MDQPQPAVTAGPATTGPTTERRAPTPVVALSTYLETSTTGGWERRSMVLPVVYRDAVVDAGAAVVLLPPQPGGAAVAERVLDGVDALVLTGGADVDPARYGQAPHPATEEPRADRDGWELVLLAAAVARGLPVLAVCRGVQLLNVAAGGTLHQHLPDVVGHRGHNPVPTVFGTTSVRALPGTRLAAVLGEGALDVRCHHHQAIDRVGEGLVVSARAADGTVEAVEGTQGFVLGVQWHTEEDGHDRRLTAALLDAARARGAR